MQCGQTRQGRPLSPIVPELRCCAMFRNFLRTFLSVNTRTLAPLTMSLGHGPCQRPGTGLHPWHPESLTRGIKSQNLGRSMIEYPQNMMNLGWLTFSPRIWNTNTKGAGGRRVEKSCWLDPIGFLLIGSWNFFIFNSCEVFEGTMQACLGPQCPRYTSFQNRR